MYKDLFILDTSQFLALAFHNAWKFIEQEVMNKILYFLLMSGIVPVYVISGLFNSLVCSLFINILKNILIEKNQLFNHL